MFTIIVLFNIWQLCTRHIVQYKWENTAGRSPRQRHDLLGTSRMHCKPGERELYNGLSVKDKQLKLFLFILLNGFGPFGIHQVSCQNFNKLRGLQHLTWIFYFHFFFYFLPLFLGNKLTNIILSGLFCPLVDCLAT